MTKTGYRSLVIPEVLYNRVREHVEASEGRYVSISEVVRKALSIFLNKKKKKEAR